MKIVLVGAGRVATQLGRALFEAGHDIVAVYSYHLSSAEQLTALVGGTATDNIGLLPDEADLFVVSVKDGVLEAVVAQLCEGRRGQTMVHTAGSMPMALFEGKAEHYGVLYPLQTFSKERRVDFSMTPIFIEASDASVQTLLHQVTSSISRQVSVLSTADRKYLHLAAVFACNFANHCYAMAATLLERHGVPFNVMLPLIDETARKVHELHPRDAQTGPAVRYDENVIGMQAQLLADLPDLQRLYLLLSESIHSTRTDNHHL